MRHLNATIVYIMAAVDFRGSRIPVLYFVIRVHIYLLFCQFNKSVLYVLYGPFRRSCSVCDIVLVLKASVSSH